MIKICMQVCSLALIQTNKYNFIGAYDLFYFILFINKFQSVQLQK